MGTLIGLLVIFVHNFMFTGEFLQSSARIKAYWSQVEMPNYYAVPILVIGIIGFAGLLLFALLIGTSIIPKFIRKQNSDSIANNRGSGIYFRQKALLEDRNTFFPDNKHSLLIMIISAGVCFVGYTIFYAQNGAVQPWYTSNLVAPILIFCFVISDYISNSLHNNA